MIPASIRNNNPLAMWPGSSAKKFGSTAFETLKWRDDAGKLHEDRCATFPTAVHGAAAAFDLLATSKLYKGKSVEAAVKTWCGDNSAAVYVAGLEKAGIDRLTVLDEAFLKDTGKALKLAKAMSRHEAGQEFPLDDFGWVRAHEMAFGDHAMPASTPTNDVPSVSPEARAQAAASDVAAKAGPVVVATSGAAAVSQNLEALQSWQTLIKTVGDLGTWAIGNWKLSGGAAAAYVLVAHVLPWWKGKQA